MRFSSIFYFVVFVSCISTISYGFEEDNEFADFEFEEDQPEVKIDQEKNEPKAPINKVQAEKTDTFGDIDDDDGIVENEYDQDEFEGFGGDIDADEKAYKKPVEPKLNIVNKVPYNKVLWHNYWIELLFICGLVVYFMNYTMGKSKNVKLANSWIQAHRAFLEDNFALVGDDSLAKDESIPGFIKESDSIYSLWCSGRTLVEGMLVELKLIKRQDLLSITMGHLLFGKKNVDQAQIKVELNKDSLDTFVMAICSKKCASKLFKEMTDLKQYCVSVAKADEKYNLPNGWSLLSEIAEASSAIIDSRLLAVLSKYSNTIESIHISDQYSGLVMQEQQDTQQAIKPETKKMLIVTYSFTEKTDMEELKPIMQLVIYLIEKLKRYKLSREGKMKADKNRQRVEEEYLKSTHQTRMEAAALKKEEKRKQEKEKLMNEDNVEKQLKMEKKMKRKDAKKAMPKMKSMNIHL